MKIEIDISGQIQQINYDSSLGMKREDGFEKSVFLRSKDKKDILRKYRGQVIDLIEKIHAILIYYCIIDELNTVSEIKICKDVNFRVLKNILPLLFKEHEYLRGIKILMRKGGDPDSRAHRIALRTFRRQKYASQLITKEMMELLLFEFKR